MKVERSIRLNNNMLMPTLGLGVWQMEEGEETEQAVLWALEAGYRLIDTAKLYGNEASVGRAVRASGIPREDIFVTTKLFPTDMFDVEGAFERSFKKLDIGYVDLYLIHWPMPGLPNMRINVWQALEKLYHENGARVRAIGVSNYGISHIEEILEYCSVPPAVNQVKFNPFSWDAELLDFCISKNIAVEAYSPLARGQLHSPVVAHIAQAHGKSPAQVFIRWALQHGTVAIPKSSHKERIRENAEVFDFELTPAEMTALDALT